MCACVSQLIEAINVVYYQFCFLSEFVLERAERRDDFLLELVEASANGVLAVGRIFKLHARDSVNQFAHARANDVERNLRSIARGRRALDRRSNGM